MNTVSSLRDLRGYGSVSTAVRTLIAYWFDLISAPRIEIIPYPIYSQFSELLNSTERCTNTSDIWNIKTPVINNAFCHKNAHLCQANWKNGKKIIGRIAQTLLNILKSSFYQMLWEMSSYAFYINNFVQVISNNFYINNFVWVYISTRSLSRDAQRFVLSRTVLSYTMHDVIHTTLYVYNQCWMNFIEKRKNIAKWN